MRHVLVEYSSSKAVEHFTDDPDLIREIRYVVFNSAEWQMLDAGLIPEETVLDCTLKRLGSDRAREIARKAYAEWEKYNLWLKPGMDRVVEELKARGQRVYVLSNAGPRLPKCWRKVLPNPDQYDGVVFSAAEGCVKPQKWIYQILFERYGLYPGECLFIDDLWWNIEGAKKCGMDGWCFSSGDVAELRRTLQLD